MWTAGSIGYGGDPASGPLLQAGNLTISCSQDFYLAGLPTGGLDTVLINSGTIVQMNTGSVKVSGAHVINLNNATYDIKSDAGIYWAAGNGADFQNFGLFQKSGGTGTSLINIDVNNTNGTMSVQSGTFRFVRAYNSINGIFNIGPGASLVVASSPAFLMSNGVFNISAGGSMNLTGSGNSSPALKGLFTGSGGGVFELSSGALSAQTPCTFDFPAGFFHWTGGALTSPGNVLTNLGEIDIDGTNIATLANNSVLANQGVILQNNLGALSMDFGSTLDNRPGGTYELQSDSGIALGAFNPYRRITNEGLFRKTVGTGQSIIQVPFDNLGGTLEVDSGAVVLAGGGSSSNGIYQIASAAQLVVASGTAINATFNVASGGVVDLTGGAAGPAYSGLLTATGPGLLVLNSGSLFAGGCTFEFPTNLFQWTGGTLDPTASSLTNLGVINASTTSSNFLNSQYEVIGCCVVNGGLLVNRGQFIHTNVGDLALGQNIRFTNASDGIYNLQSDAGISDGGGGNAVDNAGLFLKSGGTNVSLIGVPFNNYGGTIEVDSGQLTLAAGGSMNDGAFNIDTGAVLDLTGGSTATYSGLVTGSGGGTVLLSGGTVVAQVPCNFNFPSNLFQWTGGTIDVTGSVLTNLAVISASTISNNLLNGNFQGGSLVNLSLFVQNNLGSLSLGRNTHFTNAAVGLYDLQSDAGLSDVSGGFGGNAVDNVGTFRKSAGTGVSLIGVPFNNYGGTIEVESGRINLAAGGRVNDALFRVGAGAILDVTGGGSAPIWKGTLTGTGAGTVLLTNGTLNARVPCNFNFPSNLFQWVGGTIDVTGNSLTNLAFISVNTASNSILDGTFPGGILVNQGRFVELNTGDFGLGRLTHFTNTTAGLYDLQSDGGISDSSGGRGGNAVDNVGLFRKSGGTKVSPIGVPFNSFGGTVEVNSGQLTLAAGGTINSATFNVGAGAVLDLTGGSTPTYTGTVSGSGAGTVLFASGVVAARGPCNFNFPSKLFQWTGGTIDPGSGSLTNLGVININASSTPTSIWGLGLSIGGVLVNRGQFIQTNVGDLVLGQDILFTNASDGIYNLQSDSGISDGGGSIGIDNAGLFRKSGGMGVSSIGVAFNSYGGTIEVDSGTIALTTGNYDQNGGGFTVQLGGHAAGQFGRLAVTGTAALSGTLRVTLGSGFTPSADDKFQILSCSSLTGKFTTLNLPPGVSVNYSNNAVTLVVTSTGSGQPINPRLAGGNFAFSVPGIMGQSYTVQTNADLSTTNWGLYTNFVGNGSSAQVVAPTGDWPGLFFRVRQP